MPRIGQSSNLPPEEPRKRLSIAERIYAQRRLQKFADGFARSRKGNLWRKWDGLMLTVFEREEGGFAWCIADDDGNRRFSKCIYEDEPEAIVGLEIALEIED